LTQRSARLAPVNRAAGAERSPPAYAHIALLGGIVVVALVVFGVG
jgi:hypothetical protein